jgi:oxygen-independent coproporphyrinogen-3 oxidase
VQKAVNRVQSQEHILALMQRAKELKFKSTSVDLIYGLPHQNSETFSETIDILLGADPDRISIFNYAHLPSLFKPQRRIDESALPTPQEKLRMQENFVSQLKQAGYRYIGMDHFAKPDDEMSIAQQQRRLHRNFQGYSTHAECDLIGLGVSAIGKVDGCYAQNAKTVEEYQEHIERGELAIIGGFQMNRDDQLRQRVIMDLMCHLHLDIAAVEQEYGIDFNSYFSDALKQLQGMQQDKLLTVTDKEIQVHNIGSWFIRNICMAFDHYLHKPTHAQYSKVV